MTTPEKTPEAYAYDEVMDILDGYENADGDEVEHPVVAHVARRIAHYSSLAGEALRQGKDYLPLLTPAVDAPAVEIIAMELVRDVMEDELACAD